MNAMQAKTIYTIGHSTRSIEDFIALLQSFEIELLVDVRNYPGSRRFPHFNKEALEASLHYHNIRYLHLKELGGRRKPAKDSTNTRWKHDAFRGYADYMQTPEFKSAAIELEQHALQSNTAFMCSEAVWWSCHRALLSDWLKVKGCRACPCGGAGSRRARWRPRESARSVWE